MKKGLYLIAASLLALSACKLPAPATTPTPTPAPTPTPEPTPTPTPTPTPAPEPNSWVSAPLQDGNFARVKANDSLWDMTGPGAGRPLVPGEIVAVYFNGQGWQGDGNVSFAVLALSDNTNGRVLASDLEGVAPVGTPPGLPADWWVPGLVTANKTCPSATQPGQPGVTQGGVYRARMEAGSHMKLASGQTGDPSNLWIITATGDLAYSAAQTVVTGDCITGNA